MQIEINGRPQSVREEGLDQSMPLLWYLRDMLGLKGTKFGCGVGECGACTVHLNNKAVRSCVLPLGALSENDVVTTIEGLADASSLHPVQRAWIEADAPQCGYCQAGQVMAAVGFLQTHPNPTDAEIDAALSNLCRCGTYGRIRKAIHQAAQYLREDG